MKDITKKLFSYVTYSGPTGTPPPRNLDLIQSYIDQGAELDKTSPISNRDLLTTVISNTKSKKERLATIQLLVESGAKINFKNKVGFSPLKEAINLLDFRRTKYLLENGAIIKPERDLQGSKMIEKDRIDFLELLLEYGLDVNSKTSYPSTGGADDEIPIPGNSLLMDTIIFDAIKIMKCLLVNGIDIHHSQPYTGTALAKAVYYNKVQAMLLLLIAGGNPNEIVFPSGTPVLRNAISRGYLEAVQLLLKHGANIEGAYFSKDLENKNTPREVAAQIRNLVTR